ncbi:DNA polymerase III, delta prime subunit [Maridesulfovibrio hydrothermalis]|uniref:Putative DNA polymerase III, delta prime subunit n=1 Tax=Maridesulfovibrio hydrothermalis AM13 = DSM 14728 TaxID=1121451 RepID=L0RFU6_9BACT|nr:DNA polymerase III, delta prime subunit [Maridesulfovibrio hydrothermalis]CCO25080.1 putative DNA polymerase III, delta prime subunit [Maridesulfovibrio hydrothermalis AM13 = DSM 14728]
MFTGIRETASRQGIVLPRFAKLAEQPPQCLLIEGGSTQDRLDMARYWACLLNCESGGDPCGSCQPCQQIADNAFNDFLLIDREEDEKTGKVKQDISVESIRELLPVWGQPPHGRGTRVTVVVEAQHLNGNSANALLKTLEEPRPGNVFVLTAPQRERLLETLVSRSWVITLAWPTGTENSPDVAEWVRGMVEFWRSGQGWFSRTSAKGALDKEMGLKVVIGCQRELKNALINPRLTSAADALSGLFDAKGLRRLDLVLGKAQESLNYNVNPALVLDWVCTAAMPRKRR